MKLGNICSHLTLLTLWRGADWHLEIKENKNSDKSMPFALSKQNLEGVYRNHYMVSLSVSQCL